MAIDTATLDIGSRGGGGSTSYEGAGLVLLFASAPTGVPAVLPFTSASVVLGREVPAGGISLPLEGVSRLHARVTLSGGVWSIQDLESRNGTVVDGERVSHAELESGDIVHIGSALFAFVAEGIHDYDGPRGDAFPSLIGGARIGRVAAELAVVARSDLSVLVLGETGTGKEVVARGIHEASGRAGKLAAINCAAIPAGLLESELFGHKRGAFTGAERDRVGIVKSADGGTLFLDEIGDMATEAQAKVLRLLETREVTPLGSGTSDKVDVRLIAATHQDLEARVADGRFRGDLFARIHGYGVRLPPLRHRKEDIPLLVRAFLAKLQGPERDVTFACMAALLHYDWPYNVRELEAAVRRACTVAGDATLDVAHMPEAIRDGWAGYGRRAAVARESESETGGASGSVGGAPDEATLRALLEAHRGNVAAVARQLGKDRQQIHRWMKRYALAPSDFRR